MWYWSGEYILFPINQREDQSSFNSHGMTMAYSQDYPKTMLVLPFSVTGTCIICTSYKNYIGYFEDTY